MTAQLNAIRVTPDSGICWDCAAQPGLLDYYRRPDDDAAELTPFAGSVMDRCREQYRNAVVDDVIVEIDRMFGNADKSGVPLSTIHKAKGLEWPCVYWLRMPSSRRQRQAWQAQQEINLNYVAATRAQAELILAQEPDV